jgi:hypothetical protein
MVTSEIFSVFWKYLSQFKKKSEISDILMIKLILNTEISHFTSVEESGWSRPDKQPIVKKVA